jgi:RNA polymerase sigma-70 factor (ECF subfamily)
LGDVVEGVDASSGACAEVDAGSEGADLEAVFRAEYQGVARAIFRIVADSARAEELAVEVFLRWSKTRLATNQNCEGWLYRTAVRVALDELRFRARRRRYESLSRLVAPSPTPEQIRIAAEDRDAARKVLGNIGRREAELLLLRNQGFSYEEIASALHLNPASVGTLLSRAQVAFRKEYVKRYGEK